jgi:hypothetical protein
MDKLTLDDVAVMLGCSDIPSEVDYRIKECATKGCVAIVYFYEDKLNKEKQKTVIEGYEVPYTGGDSALSPDETED